MPRWLKHLKTIDTILYMSKLFHTTTFFVTLRQGAGEIRVGHSTLTSAYFSDKARARHAKLSNERSQKSVPPRRRQARARVKLRDQGAETSDEVRSKRGQGVPAARSHRSRPILRCW